MRVDVGKTSHNLYYCLGMSVRARTYPDNNMSMACHTDVYALVSTYSDNNISMACHPDVYTLDLIASAVMSSTSRPSNLQWQLKNRLVLRHRDQVCPST